MTPEHSQTDARLMAEVQAARERYETAKADYMAKFGIASDVAHMPGDGKLAGSQSLGALHRVLSELDGYRKALNTFHRVVVCRQALEE